MLRIVFGILGVAICVCAGWQQRIDRQRFRAMLDSTAPDRLSGIFVTTRSASTNIADPASREEFVAALRELTRYAPNHPQYRGEKELSVAFQLEDGQQHSLRACFSVDRQDRAAYVYGPWGTYRGRLLYQFLKKHGLV